MHNKRLPILQAFLAALLFGASAPLSKYLLGSIDPIPLAGLLYLGSGIGALLLQYLQKLASGQNSVEPKLSKADIPWMAGAVIAGGIAAPIVLMTSLNTTPAATASILLNFESIATSLIAALIFKEAIGRRIGLAIVIITLASILLSLNTSGEWGISLGALGIIAACFFWGIDNNLTRKISAKNPLTIVAIKGIVSGTFSLILSSILNKPMPDMGHALLAALLGAFSYGLSIFLFIHAMRSLGAARTSTLFGTAPFVGAALSLVILGERPSQLFWYALPIMLVGTWLMLTENHEHTHQHAALEHEHRHAHPDELHHTHSHPSHLLTGKLIHSHAHIHSPVAHSHTHTPDAHHDHSH